MSAIWKTPLLSALTQVLSLPRGAGFLSAHAQHEVPCIWWVVDPSQPLEDVRIAVVGTGWEMPPGDWRFVGTVLLGGGSLVFHVFSEQATARAA